MLNPTRLRPLGLGRIQLIPLRSYGSCRTICNPARAKLLSRPRPAYVSRQALHTSVRQQSPQATAAAIRERDSVADDGDAGPLVTRFAELEEQGLACPTLVRTLTERMKMDTMTEVQSKTIRYTLEGQDVLGQAKTGTGKTLAFLLPVIQQIINRDPSLERRAAEWRRPPDVRAIIISPTRELAEQIHAEAARLVGGTNVLLQLAVGGQLRSADLTRFRRDGCHILVGTPGRLHDLLSDPRSGVRAPELQALVLDEADRLLDDGFGPDIQKIEKLLPDRRERDRQTLLFSATFPQEVMSMVRLLMKRDYKFIRTVQPGEAQTHERVPQRVVRCAGLENYLPALLELCTREVENKERAMPFKAIVFFNASAHATQAYHLFRALQAPGGQRAGARQPFFGLGLFEMHARLTQMRRTRTAAAFRAARSAVMFSSDVSARGMDFPNVTHVISIGTPPQRDTYVHRIGRTARVDKEGESWLLLAGLEAKEAQGRLAGLPLKWDASLATAGVDLAQLHDENGGMEPAARGLVQQTVAAARTIDPGLHEAAFRALYGIFQWLPRKEQLVDAANRLALLGWGMEQPPPLSPMLARKLGLGRVQGLRVGEQRKDAWRGAREGQATLGRHGYGRFMPPREGPPGYDQGSRQRGDERRQRMR